MTTTFMSAAAVYGTMHILAYFALLRRRPEFRRERTIFLYHAVPFALFGFGLIFSLVRSGDRGAGAVVTLILTLHAIYSLSFLELWSLAEGGYSLTILARVASGAEPVRRSSLSSLTAVGIQKRQVRLAHLSALGLVNQMDGLYRLTARGRLVASLLRIVRGLANARRVG